MSRKYDSLLARLTFVLSVIAPPFVSAAMPTKSIGGWVSCSNTADQTAGVVNALAAAKNAAFTLIVDCPVHLHSGSAIDKAIFIDNGTTVQFTGTGRFFVDNLFHPAFVIANSSNITLVNWNVEWDGSVPVNPKFGGYEINGKFVASSANTPAANAFNDIVLTDWLAAHRSINFDQTQGFVRAMWPGAANIAGVFYITGDSTNVLVTGMNLAVPARAGGDHFMPMAFSMSPGWKSGQTVSAKSPQNTSAVAIPQELTFSAINLDGTLMGWVGGARNSTFENITSGRYGDLQDANGAHVGGIGKWFPPPHLFYLSNRGNLSAGLVNASLHFVDITDSGPRVGAARDKGGSDSISGYASSLKLGCNNCWVENYLSSRPDGFMDLLPSYGVLIKDIYASFDSAFLNNLYPAGIRFPSTGYTGITFLNVQLVDTANETIRGPVGNAPSASNASLVFADFNVTLNRWSGSNLPLPAIGGTTNAVAMDFAMTGQGIALTHVQKGSSSTTLEASPATITHGSSTLLNWNSSGASTCIASGSWTGSVGTSGSRFVPLAAVGAHNFVLNCHNSADVADATLHVTAR